MRTQQVRVWELRPGAWERNIDVWKEAGPQEGYSESGTCKVHCVLELLVRHYIALKLCFGFVYRKEDHIFFALGLIHQAWYSMLASLELRPEDASASLVLRTLKTQTLESEWVCFRTTLLNDNFSSESHRKRCLHPLDCLAFGYVSQRCLHINYYSPSVT